MILQNMINGTKQVKNTEIGFKIKYSNIQLTFKTVMHVHVHDVYMTIIVALAPEKILIWFDFNQQNKLQF